MLPAAHPIPTPDLSSWLPGLIVLLVLGIILNRLKEPKRSNRRSRTPLVFKPSLPPVPPIPAVPRIPEAPPPSVYRSAVHLQTPAELSFFKTLARLIEPKFRVFSKVRLADLVSPNFPARSSEWWTAFNQTAKKHIDFV